MCLRKHPALQPTVRKFRKDKLPPMMIVTCAHIDTQLQVCVVVGGGHTISVEGIA
jgi:hypothetical protein